MSGYLYDVFVSYRFNTRCSIWVKEIFQKDFEDYLTQALGREPKVYFPPAHTGEDWWAVVKQALACSRTLLPILTAEYFWKDAVCQLEFGTIWAREKKLGYRSVSNPGGLIVPIIAGDGDHILPVIGDKIHVADFKRFVRTGKGFKDSKRYMKFQDEMEGFVKDVVTAIENAPLWNPQWLHDDLVNFEKHTSDYIPDPSM